MTSLQPSWLLEGERREVCVYCTGGQGEHQIDLFTAFCFSAQSNESEIAPRHCMLWIKVSVYYTLALQSTARYFQVFRKICAVCCLIQSHFK